MFVVSLTYQKQSLENPGSKTPRIGLVQVTKLRSRGMARDVVLLAISFMSYHALHSLPTSCLRSYICLKKPAEYRSVIFFSTLVVILEVRTINGRTKL